MAPFDPLRPEIGATVLSSRPILKRCPTRPHCDRRLVRSRVRVAQIVLELPNEELQTTLAHMPSAVSVHPLDLLSGRASANLVSHNLGGHHIGSHLGPCKLRANSNINDIENNNLLSRKCLLRRHQ